MFHLNTDTFIHAVIYPPEYFMVFQLGRVYYVPSLRKYHKITQTFGSVIISLPVK